MDRAKEHPGDFLKQFYRFIQSLMQAMLENNDITVVASVGGQTSQSELIILYISSNKMIYKHNGYVLPF